MSEALSANTQALLLLTAPLMTGGGAISPDLLSHAEYNELAVKLRDGGLQPADLLTSEAAQVLAGLSHGFDEARLDRLLGRGFQLSQAVEHWQARAIWVMSRADAAYPQRLKVRLRHAAPVLLYGCGNRQLLNGVGCGGLAVVSEAAADDALVEDARDVGRQAASARSTLITRCSRGAEEAALRGALEEGGTVVGVLADKLEQAAMNRDYRAALLEEQLVLVSACDPRASSRSDNTLQRDSTVRGLADAVLVLSANTNKGSVWAAAVEMLEAARGVTVYVRSGGKTSRGLEALRLRGAVEWPQPQGAAAWAGLLRRVDPDAPSAPAQGELPFGD